MQLVPNRFLFRVRHVCPYVAGIPDDDEELFHLPEGCRIDNLADMDGKNNFADVRLAWNEAGIAIEAVVSGKDNPPTGDASKPRLSDGLSVWIDTRDLGTSHRASRFCHQFHFLPTGGGEDRDEPAVVQLAIHRALGDAPLVDTSTIPFRARTRGRKYRLAAFLPAEALSGFDPEQNPRIGFFYLVRDAERGEQSLSAANDLPYAEDPTLWQVLELVRESE